MNTLKNNNIGGIKITKISPFLIVLILGLVTAVACSGCVDEKPNTIIVPTDNVIVPTDDKVLDQAVVCETENVCRECYEDCDTCCQSDVEGEIPEITGTVERYNDRRYKVVLTVKNTHESDFVYDSVRTELDNDQEGNRRDVIKKIDYNKGANQHAGHITIAEGKTRTITIYTESLDELDNIKRSGEMTLRVALDLDGNEQCSLDATLPKYADLDRRQDLQITEVRNINDN